jgi:hypothetical protein
MPRPIHIGTSLRRKFDQQGVKALDHADCIGVGVIGRQDRQAIALRISRLGNEHASALGAQIGGQCRQTGGRIIPWIESKDWQSSGNKRNWSMTKLGGAECLGV